MILINKIDNNKNHKAVKYFALMGIHTQKCNFFHKKEYGNAITPHSF